MLSDEKIGFLGSYCLSFSSISRFGRPSGNRGPVSYWGVVVVSRFWVGSV